MADKSVVSVVALEVTAGKENDFLTLTGQLRALVRRKGYGTNHLLQDGSHPRRYYDVRIWRNADTAARAETDTDVEELVLQLTKNVRATPLVDLAWAVEIGLVSAGPWQERRVARDRRAKDRRIYDVSQREGDRREGIDRRLGPRRTGDDSAPDI